MPDSSSQKSLHALHSAEAIRNLKARYLRYLDIKMWHELGQLFTKDAVFLVPEINTELDGRDEIISWAVENLENALTIHRGHQPEINVLDDDSATGIWAMDDYIERPQADGKPPSKFWGSGYYHDVYRHGPEGWQIDRTELTRLWVSHSET